LVVLLLLSGALHVGLTPWAALWGLARWFPDADAELPPEEAVNAIPIDLLSEEPAPPKPTQPTPSEPSAPDQAEMTLPEPEAPRPAPAKPPEPKPERPPAEPAAPPPEQEPQGGSPVALSGAAGKIADSNANVQLVLYTDRIREHALGRRVGRLLQTTPQWQDFFGPARVDPIRDIDRVLIAGPQLRDSSNVVAVVQHSLPDDRLERGVEALVALGNGEWLDGDTKIARTRADRAERLIALPAPGLVVVVPPSAEKSARALGKGVRFPEGPEGVAVKADIKTPWRVFLGLPVSVPKTIERVRIEVRPRADGGAVLELVGDDESPEAAARDAREIEQLIRAASELDLGGMGAMGALGSLLLGKSQHRMLEKVSVRAEGKQILGTIEVSLQQLSLIMDLAATAIEFQAQRRRERAPVEAPRAHGGRDVSVSPSQAAPSGESSPTPKEPQAAPEPDAPASPPSAPDRPSPPQNDGPVAGE
jgi:outer membrane biosynthesis protein TonB